MQTKEQQYSTNLSLQLERVEIDSNWWLAQRTKRKNEMPPQKNQTCLVKRKAVELQIKKRYELTIAIILIIYFIIMCYQCINTMQFVEYLI